MIGAGSTVFCIRLLTDILTYPELKETEFVLVDIDKEKLRTSESIARNVVKQLNPDTKIFATTDRHRALDGADYVINMIKVGGLEASVLDTSLPRKYGLKQTIGDTIGVGGVMRGIRTIPVLLSICKDMEEQCPDAIILNYTNPQAILTWAVQSATPIRFVGLCHSVQGTANMLARWLDLSPEDLDFLCAGINHTAWFIKLEHRGEDLYPVLRKFLQDKENFMKEPVRAEIFRRLGYFHTESSNHAAEYSPFFMDRDELIEKYKIQVDRFKININSSRERYRELKRKSEAGEAVRIDRSHEYGSGIIHSMETGQPRIIYGNVLNHGLIRNLPEDCVVEVPCLVDRNGVRGCYVGEIPAQCAAANLTHINVHRLAVKSVLEHNREMVAQALMFDPLTSAVLTLDQIWDITGELLDAHRQYLEGVFEY